MERDSTFDVAVVGGSIAGTTTATFLARQGLRVALIEAHSDPGAYKALCTHLIQPCGIPTLERLGVAGAIEAAGGRRNKTDLWTRWGWLRLPEMENPPYGYGITRRKLDPMLRSNAASTPGVELMLGRTATGLVREGDRVAGVEVRDREGGISTIRARLVVAADGRHSKIAELAGVGAWSMPNRRSGYFAYFEGIEGVDSVKFWMLDPDVLYMFPNEDGLVILAAMFGREDKLDWFKKDFTGNLRRIFDRLPEAPDLSGARQVSKVLGEVNLPNLWRKAGPPGLAFVGDAMVAGDPLWGVGCGWALQMGEWLAESVEGHAGNQKELDGALAAYRKTVRKQLLGHYLMTSEYARYRRYNPAEKLLISAGTKDHKLAAILNRWGARTAPISEMLSPRTVARAAFVKLRTRSLPAEVKRNREIGRDVVVPPAAEEVNAPAPDALEVR